MKLERHIKLNKKAEDVWALLRRFDSDELYYTIGTLASVEVRDGRKCRTFVNIDRSRTVQALEECDDKNMSLSYETLETPLAVSEMHSTWQVTHDGDGSRLSCTASFLVDGGSEEEIKSALYAAWDVAIPNFKKRIEGNR